MIVRVKRANVLQENHKLHLKKVLIIWPWVLREQVFELRKKRHEFKKAL
jgi:hypothetical protein